MRIAWPNSLVGRIGAGLAVALCAGALFVLIAPYNVAARLEHFPGVRWLLDTYMQNSVRTWSSGVEVPEEIDLQDPALIRLGASHFEAGCAPCHGAPGRLPNPITRGMRPEPPFLKDHLAQYEEEELYWIVWNGIKYSGMPAWPGATREDEPWAVVAFLNAYPELDAEEYVNLAYGSQAREGISGARRMRFGNPTGTLRGLTSNCARCHEADGLGRDGVAPKIAGQSREYLEATLAAFATGARPSGFMEPVAASLSPEEISRLALFYSRLPPFQASEPMTDPDRLVRLGEVLAKRGTSRIPSCLSCHGDDLTPARNPLYPRILGQDKRFLSAWLHQWRDGEFGGTRHANIMHEVAYWLSDEEIEALVAYFSAGKGQLSSPALGQSGREPELARPEAAEE